MEVLTPHKLSLAELETLIISGKKEYTKAIENGMVFDKVRRLLKVIRELEGELQNRQKLKE